MARTDYEALHAFARESDGGRDFLGLGINHPHLGRLVIALQVITDVTGACLLRIAQHRCLYSFFMSNAWLIKSKATTFVLPPHKGSRGCL
jgi:hypothetical protein